VYVLHGITHTHAHFSVGMCWCVQGGKYHFVVSLCSLEKPGVRSSPYMICADGVVFVTSRDTNGGGGTNDKFEL